MITTTFHQTLKKDDEHVAVLDIGSGYVTCLIAKKNASKQIELCGLGRVESCGILGESIFDFKLAEKSVSAAIAIAQKDAGITVSQVLLSFSATHLHREEFNLTKKLGTLALTQAQLQDWLQNASDDFISAKEGLDEMVVGGCKRVILHVLVKSFALDDLPHADPVGACSAKLDATLSMIAMKENVHQQLIKLLDLVGVEVIKIVASSYADFFVIQENMLLDHETIILNMGTHMVTIGWFQGGLLQELRWLNIGSDYITRDIMEAFGVSRLEAESLKCEKGFVVGKMTDKNNGCGREEIQNQIKRSQFGIQSSVAQKGADITMLLPRIITPRVEEIFDYVAKTFTKMPKDAVVVLSGGGGQLPGLLPIAREYLSRRILMQTAPHALGLTFSGNSRAYTTALGLLKLAYTQVPDYAHMQKKERKSNSWLDKLKKLSKESPSRNQKRRLAS